MYKILTQDLRTLCKNASETIDHLLYDCPQVQPFYKLVVQFINEEMEFVTISENVSKEQVLFNTKVDRPTNVANFIFLVLKYHIYVCRYLKENPNVWKFKNAIFTFRNIEKYNTIQTNSIAKHLKKWYITL